MTALRTGFLVAFLATLVSGSGASGQTADAPPAPPVTAPAPEVAADALEAAESRGGVFGGILWGSLDGSEVEKADPAMGFEGGAFWHLWRGISVWGSYAVSSHDVNGQLLQLLDQPVRAGGRSATVEGSVQVNRARAGVRLDALRQAGWRFVPYAVAAVCFSSIEVTVDKVDGADPVPVPDAAGNPVDIRSLDDTQLGGLGRFGVECEVSPILHVDVHGSFEVFEFPAGTNASATAGAGLVYRF